MQKNVQIPYELFLNLIRYHLFDIKENEAEIRKELENKANALNAREFYKKSKTGGTEAEREEARRKYLDVRGVPESFRW